MREISSLLYLSTKDKMSLKDNYIKAIKDPEFKSYISSLNTTEEILIKYTTRLKEAFEENKKCSKCKHIEECKNKQCGFVLTPMATLKSISFSYDACKYEQERIEKTRYQENITLYDLPKSIKEATLKSIYTDDKNRVSIIMYFKDFMENYGSKELKGIYLYGSFGTGKTYLVASLLNEFAKRGTKSVIVYYPEFLRSLKESFSTDYKEKFRQVERAPLLLIDDIGAENLTAWSRDEVLGPILQYRMDEKLPTFFTSNLNLEDLEVHLSMTSNGVEKIKARRIIERIKQLSNVLNLTSKNRRD